MTRNRSKNVISLTAIHIIRGGRKARGSLVVKELCYKPEGRGFDTR
jgi:hypothetical protein